MFDMHLHSWHSPDATGTLEEFVARAAERDLTGISFTEHDNINSAVPGRKAAEDRGLTYINGVELGAWHPVHEQSMGFHLLCYGFDLQHPAIRELLRSQSAREEEHTLLVMGALERQDIHIDRELFARHVKEQNWPDIGLNGMQLRRVVRLMGHAKDGSEAFRLQQSVMKEAGHDTSDPHTARAIDVCAAAREADGITVLAHVYECRPPEDKDPRGHASSIIAILVEECGIDGLEVFHYSNPDDEVPSLLQQAKRYGLAVTGGSDAHGPGATGNTTCGDEILQKLQ